MIRARSEEVVKGVLDEIFGPDFVFPVHAPKGVYCPFVVFGASQEGSDQFQSSKKSSDSGVRMQTSSLLRKRELVAFSQVGHRFDLYQVRVYVPEQDPSDVPVCFVDEASGINQGIFGLSTWQRYVKLIENYRLVLEGFRARLRFFRSSLPDDTFDDKVLRSTYIRSFLIQVAV